MEQFCQGRTTLVIAHRLHTVIARRRDLCRWRTGARSESGRHDELLRKGGRYASFYTAAAQDTGAG